MKLHIEILPIPQVNLTKNGERRDITPLNLQWINEKEKVLLGIIAKMSVIKV